MENLERMIFVLLLFTCNELLASYYPDGYKGCYVDKEDRILEERLPDSLTNSGNNCKYRCTESQYRYAGTEYAEQCFCGHKLKDYEKTPDSACNMTCPGNADEYCGGSWRISIYDIGAVDCNFDDGLCNWIQDDGDNFDWTRLSGATPNNYTGPKYDHTSGEGYYVFIDTSKVEKNKKARLISPQKDAGLYCFSLWYYMYGRDVYRLRVSTKEGNDMNKKIEISGSKGQRWILKQIQIDTQKEFKIIIEGTVKNQNPHNLGDIAIDDIVMFSSKRCPTDCGNPVPPFGLADSEDIEIGSKVQITCQTGYKVTGSPSIICQANGTWSDRPVCNIVECGEPTFNRGINADMSEGTNFNMTIMLDCVEGFTLIGNAYVICKADGNWTTQPNCVINNCSDPTPESGNVNSTNNFEYGSVVEVTCIPGYKIIGSSPITCLANSTWSDTPRCEQIDCKTKTITNGHFNATFGTTFGKTATQSCNTGYSFAGDKTVTCSEAGWNGSIATCTIVDCSVPFLTDGILAETPNGTTYNKSAVIACAEGYTLSGNAYVTCQADGNWTVLPNCNIEVLNCLGDTDHMDNHWQGEVSGNKTVRHCPPGYDGIVTRYCNESGAHRKPVYYCTSSVIADIYRNVVQGGDNVNVTEVLDALANATSGASMGNSLLIGDLNTITATLSKITDIITVNTTNVDHLANSFMETANNIIEEKTTPTWTVMLHETGSGADRVLQSIDRFVEKIVSTTNETTAFRKSNLYLKIGTVRECETVINFPDRGSEVVPEWVNTRQDRLLIRCDNKTVQSYSGVMYRNLSKIMPATTNGNRPEALQLNAPVISFTLFPNVKPQLDSPVEIRFQLYNKNLQNASCSFWTMSNSSQGFWSEDDCQQQEDDQKNGIVVCTCNHLTNFAVLMSPTSPSAVVDDHATALSIISKTGCVISMLCLFLNVAIHAYFWRVIKSVRSIIHIHLSCSLFLAYILFLTGINRTENEGVCRAIAALLHLVFLIVFFIMLTEGCHLAYTVIKPLSTRKPGIPLLVLSYVLAVVIVAASMGTVQMEGYGSEKVCWLSTESGLIWSFIGPVLVVILINLIVLCMVIWVMCGTAAISRKALTGKAWAALRGILILMPIMGLTWVFGVFSVNQDTLVFQYLFAILNILQGLLIFVFHCLMNKKIRDAFRIQRNRWRTSHSAGLSDGPKMETKNTDL